MDGRAVRNCSNNSAHMSEIILRNKFFCVGFWVIYNISKPAVFSSSFLKFKLFGWMINLIINDIKTLTTEILK